MRIKSQLENNLKNGLSKSSAIECFQIKSFSKFNYYLFISFFEEIIKYLILIFGLILVKKRENIFYLLP